MFLEGMGMRARQCGIGIATTWGTQPVWEELVGLKRKTRWQSGAADTPACTKLIEMGRRDERHRRNDIATHGRSRLFQPREARASTPQTERLNSQFVMQIYLVREIPDHFVPYTEEPMLYCC